MLLVTVLLAAALTGDDGAVATLKQNAIGVHRQDGRTNIAAALRHTARDCRRSLTALGLTG
ncbi:hypothetical protein ACWGPD_13250 [Streptomyces hirsutus]|uniref:hypothetical protein n=1 Tax=Streptomyces hirsutus TaxID=35620 RepID=UPI00331EA37F